MKIMLVFGTRPEAIKMCPIIKELNKRTGIEYKVCLTGQHREMLDQMMQVFEIQADYNLEIMRKKQTLSTVTTGILSGLNNIYELERPDLILVHGDTTTAFVAGLAAFYRKIPVGHVEAGLRTYNLDSPFPEEFNRQAIDLFSDYYFAPTEWARDNLIKEGKDTNKIFVTGNTVIDALDTTIREDYEDEIIRWAQGSKLIILTAHRRENIGDNMRHIFEAVQKIVEDNEDIKVVYPIHLNPVVREIAKEYLVGNDRIRLIEPLDVIEFHNYMKRAYLVMTDSGGIQEEAPALGKPVLVLRDTTERPEGVEAGTSILVGTEKQSIIEAANRLIQTPIEYERMTKLINPYGDGQASKRIVDILLKEA